MTSILRLNKDRSSFLFRRNGANDGANNDKLELTLPDISRLDTKSFSDLFDQFTNYPTPDEPTAHIYESPTSSLSTRFTAAGGAKPDLRTQAMMSQKTYGNQYSNLYLDIARNDSTGSSRYSQASQRESDFSPLVTRQSSSSSYSPCLEPWSTDSTAVPAKNKPSNISIKSVKHASAGTSGSYETTHRSRSKARSPGNQLPLSPLNLDKPLPPGPDERKAASLSAPNLLLTQSSKSVKPVIKHNRCLLSTPTPSQPAFSHPERTTSVRRASTGQSISELPAWTPKAIREARRGKAAAPAHRRKRSASEDVASRDPTITLQKRHTMNITPSSVPATMTGGLQLPKRRRQQPHSLISATTAENVIHRIMSNLDSLDDLVSAALVSKGFLRTFQRNESALVSHIMFKTSPPAWELRRSILAQQDSNIFSVKDFRDDFKTLATWRDYALKQHHRNGSLFKPATLDGLLGYNEQRRVDVENAFQRIWTFCVLFGGSTDQAGTAQIQIDWLNGSRAPKNQKLGAGFGVGNHKGLGTSELEDISEIWHSLQSLLAGFHGREQEARRYGVFDNWQVGQNTSEQEHLTEWISHLVALGPRTLLSVSSCSFQQAAALGLSMNWGLPPVGQSRTSFLMAAISQVYQDRLIEEATLKAARFSMPRIPTHRPTRSFDERQLSTVDPSTTKITHAQSLRIDTSVPKRRPVSTFVTATASTRLEIRPDCDPLNLPSGVSNILPTSPSADPSVFYGLAAAPAVSTKLGATLFPMQYAVPGPRIPFQQPERAAQTNFEVIDPVDKAMNVLVKELGFEETRARKALAMCDSGSGIDLQKAVELLAIDAKAVTRRPVSPVELPTPQDLVSPKAGRKQPKTYCSGHCKTSGSVHSRKKSTGSASIASVSPISMIEERRWQSTVTVQTTGAETTPRAKSVGFKAWKVLGMNDKPYRKNSILGMEEYQAKVERKKSMRATSGSQAPRVKEGLSTNLLGIGLGMGGSAVGKNAETQLEHARAKERLKKERPGTFYRPRNNASAPLFT
ncbi:uncharacterized protein A1O9_03317 [Exophiala aquamarina CBS 119918]|uniref:UBA domain-containing protein n=1 Tax=Exophiala aquamarina CBS 119918 TaxID=1182545 RepID=A0A072PPT9_9EURO|nr:uncharacterized protein A1O9_03317 [Exophiala aquamarina CBS 119918]KEF61747.1 hypothetical protein A1O9_03317 [Exophiala aquamarina CBS 119918]